MILNRRDFITLAVLILIPIALQVVEMSREERLGPGGLDPVEVLESLPKDMVCVRFEPIASCIFNDYIPLCLVSTFRKNVFSRKIFPACRKRLVT